MSKIPTIALHPQAYLSVTNLEPNSINIDFDSTWTWFRPFFSDPDFHFNLRCIDFLDSNFSLLYNYYFKKIFYKYLNRGKRLQWYDWFLYLD